MTTLQELFKELDDWEQHSPKSWAGSMGRTAKINDIQRQIKEAITIEDIRIYRGESIMIFVMLSPLLIIVFIALSIIEERKRKKKTQHKENEFEKEKNKMSNPNDNNDHDAK